MDVTHSWPGEAKKSNVWKTRSRLPARTSAKCSFLQIKKMCSLKGHAFYPNPLNSRRPTSFHSFPHENSGETERYGDRGPWWSSGGTALREKLTKLCGVLVRATVGPPLTAGGDVPGGDGVHRLQVGQGHQMSDKEVGGEKDLVNRESLTISMHVHALRLLCDLFHMQKSIYEFHGDMTAYLPALQIFPRRLQKLISLTQCHYSLILGM